MNNAERNIIYLYSEVMPYVITIMKELRNNFNVNVHCISWDFNKTTPFIPQNQEGIFFYKRSEFDNASLIKFLEKLDPQVILMSGRMDKGYLQAALHFRKKDTPIITFCDNQWYGTLKNRLSSLFGYYLYRRYFNYIVVAGRRQYEFAKRVGYPNNNVLNNMLTADVELFKEHYARKRRSQTAFPKTIVFVGRFVPLKNIGLLIEAFKNAKTELASDWKLIIVGSGELEFKSDEQAGIEVKDFMSPEQLAENSKGWGVFCLPSYFDNFGVVVHEFAAAGMPLICSDSVGAVDSFLIENYNGYVFKNRSLASLQSKLKQVMQKTDDELWQMADRSSEMANAVTPTKGAYYIMSVLSKEK